MKPSINLDKKDPKICLLTKILKHFDDKTTQQLLARNNIHNTNLMTDCIKIVLMTMYFDYTISDMLREINRNKKLWLFRTRLIFYCSFLFLCLTFCVFEGV